MLEECWYQSSARSSHQKGGTSAVEGDDYLLSVKIFFERLVGVFLKAPYFRVSLTSIPIFTMSGSSLGHLFCVTNFGESHGPAIGCVVDGCPPGLSLDASLIQRDLDRRRPGTSRHVTQRQEPDQVEILSGLYEGKTTGTPIALLIRNQDQRSSDYQSLADTFRPGHADYTYWQKYGFRDPRGGGRSSARLTAPTVAAGAIARHWLSTRYGIVIRAYLAQLGSISIPFRRWEDVEQREQNPFWVADLSAVPSLEAYMDQLRREGDSVGARIHVHALGVPPGWGEPIYDRLDADIAHVMMGINAVKGVEIGDGFASIAQKGSEHGDGLSPQGFLSNHAGGILGGISTGQDLRVAIALKPTSSIRLARPSINRQGEAVEVATQGRHDPCVGLRAAPIAEACLAIVLMDHALRHRAQCADISPPLPPIPAKVSPT